MVKLSVPFALLWPILFNIASSQFAETLKDFLLNISPYESLAYKCTEEYQTICMSCVSVGVCRKFGEGFVVVRSAVCVDDNVCSEAFGNTGCYRLSPELSPVCSCKNGKACEIDPFDSSSYVICGDPITYGSCEANNALNLDTCECEGVCMPCGAFYPGPDPSSCASYYNCATGNWTAEMCPEGECFNPDKCACLEECRPCGFIPDPDNPSGFYYCENGDYVPGLCSNGTIYDGDFCDCFNATYTTEVFVTTTSSTDPESTTTPSPDKCAYCGYYPSATSCSKYFKCNDDGTASIRTCPGELCFDPVSCYCDIPA